MMTEMGILLAFALGMMALYLVAWIFLVPFKLAIRFLLNSLAGGIAVILINGVGGLFGFHIALNLLSAACIGLLGIPGILLWILLF